MARYRKLTPEVKPESNLAKRTEAQAVRDLEILARGYVRGVPLGQILDHINANPDGYTITMQQLKLDLESLRQAWLQSALANFDEAKAKELAHIDELERAYWEGWLESRRDKTTTASEEIDDVYGRVKEEENKIRLAMGLPVEKADEKTANAKTGETYTRRRSTSKVEGRVGDPRFLQGVAECINLRAKIFGLFEPLKFQVSWKAEAAKAGIPESVANQQFARLVEGLTEELNKNYDRELAEGRDPDLDESLPEDEED